MNKKREKKDAKNIKEAPYLKEKPLRYKISFENVAIQDDNQIKKYSFLKEREEVNNQSPYLSEDHLCLNILKQEEKPIVNPIKENLEKNRFFPGKIIN